jgi:ubiquitin carboxyl-terminal hydrolase L5
MVPRPKRRRLTDPLEEVASKDICKPATQLEKSSWNGFCEIESEPVSLHRSFATYADDA